MSFKEELDQAFSQNYKADEETMRSVYQNIIKPAALKTASEGRQACTFFWKELNLGTRLVNKKRLLELVKQDGLTVYESPTKDNFSISGWGDDVRVKEPDWATYWWLASPRDIQFNI
jgi:hypothetical protein